MNYDREKYELHLSIERAKRGLDLAFREGTYYSGPGIARKVKDISHPAVKSVGDAGDGIGRGYTIDVGHPDWAKGAEKAIKKAKHGHTVYLQHEGKTLGRMEVEGGHGSALMPGVPGYLGVYSHHKDFKSGNFKTRGSAAEHMIGQVGHFLESLHPRGFGGKFVGK